MTCHFYWVGAIPLYVLKGGLNLGDLYRSAPGASRFRIIIANEVGFVGNVKGFRRRIQSATNLRQTR